ncbi:meiotic nuclear division protein 1 homolog [Anoplophora glabripennis]|uniref:meiotic nuclear division protein 1 homolog n=1 Tax=Anoplophora glabripennis TaxID=217634 RepID=UPI000874792F|nr:meiotic nuclear division protein 1 homolog [Anoplophora glabripennis]
MSRKGVSAEEKRSRMLQLFHEKGECFQLKELEKIAPKEKGIIANSVKDVVQKLVEDGLVETDKIGTSVYFWSFPSKAIGTKKRKIGELQIELEESSKKLKIMQQTIEQSKDCKDEHNTRNKVLDEIGDLELELNELKKKLKTFQENDHGAYKSVLENTNKLKDAANRWTDNIFATKSWCKKKFFIEDSVLNKQFGIPEDLDYIE